MERERPEQVVEIEEMTNTWGCCWNNPGGRTQYGFSTWPHAASLWLACAEGNAVSAILDAGLGTVIHERPGAYGGKCRTIRVDRDALEAMCRKYWDRVNAASKPAATATCHYCGQPATSTGFFGEAVCDDCGGR